MPKASNNNNKPSMLFRYHAGETAREEIKKMSSDEIKDAASSTGREILVLGGLKREYSSEHDGENMSRKEQQKAIKTMSPDEIQDAASSTVPRVS